MIIKETGFGTSTGIALSKTGLGLVIPFGIAVILKTASGIFHCCYHYNRLHYRVYASFARIGF